MTIEFEAFPKIPRWKRLIVVTEKLDGTNAQIYVPESPDEPLQFGSRNRWVTPADDNYGFARWGTEHSAELRELGPGRHFGEWWGLGIQRGYGLTEKRFSLFNTGRWGGMVPTPCNVVPVLYAGPMDEHAIEEQLQLLRMNGSAAAPGFMRSEGVVIYHAASRAMFKRTLEKDEEPKGAS